MAHRVLQFPVRNAFYAQREDDYLARDTQNHALRIAEQVENEIARQAYNAATGRSAEFAAARHGLLVTMPGRPGHGPLTAIKAFASRILARA